jgi:hypothetical protein
MFIQLETPKVTVSVPTIEIDGTKIFREAYLSGMNYSIDSASLTLLWTVQHFSFLDGKKGSYLSFVPDYTRKTIADNSTMCDVTNGYPIAKIVIGQDESGVDILDYDSNVNYTGQYDFFCAMAETKDVNVHAMIRQFGNMITEW